MESDRDWVNKLRVVGWKRVWIRIEKVLGDSWVS